MVTIYHISYQINVLGQKCYLTFCSEFPISCYTSLQLSFLATQKNKRTHQSLGMCCCSVVQSFGLCDPMDCSVPGFLFLHYLIFMSAELVIPYNLLILCHSFSSCPQFFPASESFPMSCLSASGGQSIGASASALVIPKNIQG